MCSFEGFSPRLIACSSSHTSRPTHVVPTCTTINPKSQEISANETPIAPKRVA